MVPSEGVNLEGGKLILCRIFCHSYQFPPEFPAKNISVFLWWSNTTAQINDKMADHCEKQFDFFTSLILDFSLYLGLTLLAIMVTLGLYFFIKYCCCKRCRKRWVLLSFIRAVILMFRARHSFSGIRSQPSFVATIQFAFSNNLTTFTEIGKTLHSSLSLRLIKIILEMSHGPPALSSIKKFL